MWTRSRGCAGSPRHPSRSRRPAVLGACPPRAAKPSPRLVPACSRRGGLVVTIWLGLPWWVREGGEPVVPSFAGEYPVQPVSTRKWGRLLGDQLAPAENKPLGP